MKYVDLFAGCGGLSLGIERAGGSLVAAVEKSEMAARTFFHNFVGDASDVLVWRQHVAKPVTGQLRDKVLVSELSRVLADEDVMRSLTATGIDLVVGGPPCQGFSLAGRRRHDDLRNRLAWEYLEFVEAVDPRAVVIENVVGMSRRFELQEESSFSQLRKALTLTGRGYVVQAVLVNAMHYGAPQHRPRLMLIAVRSDVAEDCGIEATEDIWKSAFLDKVDKVPPLAPVPTVRSYEVATVSDAVADLIAMHDLSPDEKSRNTAYKCSLDQAAFTLRTRPEDKSAATIPNHVYRKHSDRVRERFVLYRFLSENGLDGRLLNRLAGLDEEAALLAAKKVLSSLNFPVYLPSHVTGEERIRIESVEVLSALAVRLATKKHSQKVLRWDEPARTVVTLPDDYVHPKVPRIFTVRELARFQGFPDCFEFLGAETTGSFRRRLEVPQYTQVGNAVSPWQSYAVGALITGLIERHTRVLSERQECRYQ